MDQQGFSEWAKRQDVVKVRTIKKNEEDKYILTVGNYMVAPFEFDTQEEAEQYLEDNFKLNNLDLSIIGAMCQRLNEIHEQDQSNPKNEEK